VQPAVAVFLRASRYIFFARSLRVAILKGIALALLIYLGALGRAAWKLRSFRRSPATAGARYLLEGEWPQTIPLRFFILKRGTYAYRADTRGWLYKTTWLGDYWWNRVLLERDLASMPPFERDGFLSFYHLSITPQIRKLALEQLGRDDYHILPLLYRDPNPSSRAQAAEWIKSYIIKAGDAVIFTEAFPYLLGGPAVPVSTALDQFWPRINADQRDHIVEALFSGTKQETALDVLEWLRHGLPSSELGQLSSVIGKLLTIESSRQATLSFVSQRLQYFDPDSLGHILGNIRDPQTTLSVAVKIFYEVNEHVPSLAAECLARIAQVNVREAEKLAAPLLAGSDSELRKGALVVLADAGSPVGQTHIDEAFSGSAPRTRKFRDWKTYLFGSRATQEYKMLSHHDYLETGKTWPPARIGSDDDTTPDKWMAFIQRYPWFPGTDDAYYRLAAELYVGGDPTKAVAVIRDYASRSLPDTDADPYIMHVLKLICSRQEDFVMADPLLANVHAITANSLSDSYWSHRSMKPLIDALTWFQSNPDQIRFLGIDVNQLKDFAQLVQTFVDGPSFASSDRRVDLALLYGRFFSPQRSSDKGNLQVGIDPSDTAISTAVDKVRAILSAPDERGTPDFAQASAWVLWHMEEGNVDLRSAFQPVFDALANVPQRDLPPAISIRIFRILNR
jgi:hypothetical protein